MNFFYGTLMSILLLSVLGDEKYFYSVAVIKKNSLTDVHNLYNLRNKKACFPSVGSLAGWVIPIETVEEKSSEPLFFLFSTFSSSLLNMIYSCEIRIESMNKYDSLDESDVSKIQ